MTQTSTPSRRGRGWALALAGALSVGPGAAWACMPDSHGYEEPTVFEGEAGEVIWRYGQIKVARMSPAEDLGGGFAVQYLRDGNGCYSEVYTIVQDCASGEALAYGDRISLDHMGPIEVLEELNTLVAEHARLGAPLSIAEVSAEAQARGVESVVPMRTDSHLRQGEGEFQLGAACRMFYPDMSPNPEQ